MGEAEGQEEVKKGRVGCGPGASRRKSMEKRPTSISQADHCRQRQYSFKGLCKEMEGLFPTETLLHSLRLFLSKNN